MVRFIVCCLFILSLQYAFAQQESADSIVAEGKRLFRLEMASWYGTDIFMERFQGQRANIGGYVSYEKGDGVYCVFFSKEEKPVVLATIRFDSSFSAETAVVDSSARSLSQLEHDLASIRRKAIGIINEDSLFKAYNNTSFNVIPILSDAEKKAYVLTGPKVSGVVVLGNDYLISFDQTGELKSKRMLHRNIIPMEYGEEGEHAFATMHTHLPETGDYITATDICTLMLYGRFTDWKQHIVLSERYVSIWSFENSQLAIITREVWDKIGEDKGKEKGKEKD